MPLELNNKFSLGILALWTLGLNNKLFCIFDWVWGLNKLADDNCGSYVGFGTEGLTIGLGWLTIWVLGSYDLDLIISCWSEIFCPYKGLNKSLCFDCDFCIFNKCSISYPFDCVFWVFWLSVFWPKGIVVVGNGVLEISFFIIG